MTPGAPDHHDVSEAHILVVEDDGVTREHLVDLLAAHWQVEAVGDGIQALTAARANPPDLILSDVGMPGMDGLALLRALRENQRTRTIPVMLLSARGGEQATIEGLESGADEYLVKGFSATELLTRVRAQLALARLRNEATTSAREYAEEATRLLVEARRKAAAHDQSFAVASHDLRTPLDQLEERLGSALKALTSGVEGPAKGWLENELEVALRQVRQLRQVADAILGPRAA